MIDDKSTVTLAKLLSGQIDSISINPDDWPSLIACAQQNNCAPLLYWVISRSNSYELGNPELLDQLSDEFRNTLARHMLLQHYQQELNTTFEKAGILCVWMKGIALSSTVYPEPALRPMADIDCIIPADQKEQALQLAQSLGFDFVAAFSAVDTFMQKYSHHYHLRGGVDNAIMFELHYRLLGHVGRAFLADDQVEWFLSQRELVATGNFYTFSPTAHILYLCAHMMLQHGEYITSLNNYYDLHLLITQEDIDWNLLVNKAHVLGWTFAVEKALSNTTQLFKTSIPADILSTLTQNRSAHDHIDRITSLTARENAFKEQISAKLRILSWPDRLRLILFLVFPSQSYMRYRYNLSSNTRFEKRYSFNLFEATSEKEWRNEPCLVEYGVADIAQ